MASSITPQQRKEMEEFLLEHPVNPDYDEECNTLDGAPPRRAVDCSNLS